MNKHFDYYFPPNEYRPIDLIKIDNKNVVITRVKYESGKEAFTHVSTILKNNIYSQLTPDENVVCASIVVPHGKIVEVVKRCNDDSNDCVSAICGPIKTMYINQGLFSSEHYLRVKYVERDIYEKMNVEFIECQRKLVLRLYRNKLFNNFKFSEEKFLDIPISTVLEYPNFMRYQSMIVPYGIYIDDAGELVPNENDCTSFSIKKGKLNGPCHISDISQLYVYYQQSYIHSVINDEGPFEKKRISKKDIEPIVKQIIKSKTVVVSKKNLKVTVKLSHYIYQYLKPLLGMYFLSNCLGDAYTKIIRKECSWDIRDDDIKRLVLFWLIKTRGDYSYIAPIFNNPKYNKICAEAIVFYTKKTQY